MVVKPIDLSAPAYPVIIAGIGRNDMRETVIKARSGDYTQQTGAKKVKNHETYICYVGLRGRLGLVQE